MILGTAACSDDKPSASRSDRPKVAPATSVAAAVDCAQLAVTYVALEHGRLLANLKLAAAAPSWTEPPSFDTAYRVPEADLAAAVARLRCGPELGPLLLSALDGVLAEAGVPRKSDPDPSLAPARPGVVVRPAGFATATPNPSDDLRFHWHYGRTYLFSMVPNGSLTPVDGSSATFDNNFLTSSSYRDADGNVWQLYGEFWSRYHQPAGVSDYPNKKFVLPDSRGGSFEAVLMPDGATATAPVKPPYTYKTSNWLTTGPLMGTYNYSDGGASLASFFGHFGLDVLWHELDQHGDKHGYVNPQRLLGPESDYLTFVQRYLDQVKPLAKGQVIVRGSDGRVYWAVTHPDGTVTAGEPIDADLADLAIEFATYLGRKPATVPVTAGTSPCAFSYHRPTSCSSRHPEVIVYQTSLGDTRACTFTSNVAWGDASQTPPLPTPGSKAGELFLARHTYRQPGVYTISLSGTVNSGTCRSQPETYTFTLLAG